MFAHLLLFVKNLLNVIAQREVNEEQMRRHKNTNNAFLTLSLDHFSKAQRLLASL